MNESRRLITATTPTNDSDAVALERPNTLPPNDLPAFAHGSYGYDRSEEEQQSHLLDYWRIVRKHFWLIIGISFLIPTLVAIYIIRKPDIYDAQARIQVDLENSNSLLGGMSKNSPLILNAETNDPAYFNTQLQILTGPGLLRRVAKNLDLEHNAEFGASHSSGNRTVWASLRRVLGLSSKMDKPAENPAVPVTSTYNKTEQELVEAERLSDYIDKLH